MTQERKSSLFNKLKFIEGWSWEITLRTTGDHIAEIKKLGSKLSMTKIGKSWDELAEWIINETKPEEA